MRESEVEAMPRTGGAESCALIRERGAEALTPHPLAQPTEPKGANPAFRWCGRTAEITCRCPLPDPSG
jgi:hypothetical protein